METLLRLDPRPDGVFCYNDPAAVGAMNAILGAGLRIPEDIAVVGAGNIRYGESFRVPLSSIDVSCCALGESAGKLALSLVNAKARPRTKTILIEPKLIVRQSSIRASVV